MYLCTLCLDEWSVKRWTMESENGIKDSNENRLAKRRKRRDVHGNSKQFLKQFLKNLNKLLSHYDRKETNKSYLEQCF